MWSDPGMGSRQTSMADPACACRAHLGIRFLLSFTYGIQVASSYLLMLAIMTYNAGYFFVIVGGLSAGHFLFSSSLYVATHSSEACCPQPGF